MARGRKKPATEQSITNRALRSGWNQVIKDLGLPSELAEAAKLPSVKERQKHGATAQPLIDALQELRELAATRPSEERTRQAAEAILGGFARSQYGAVEKARGDTSAEDYRGVKAVAANEAELSRLLGAQKLSTLTRHIATSRKGFVAESAAFPRFKEDLRRKLESVEIECDDGIREWVLDWIQRTPTRTVMLVFADRRSYIGLLYDTTPVITSKTTRGKPHTPKWSTERSDVLSVSGRDILNLIEETTGERPPENAPEDDEE